MTALWPADELAAATSGLMPRAFDATGVSIDTRSLRPGDLFVALVAQTDGHAHAAAALTRGAAGVMVHRKAVPAEASALLVIDTLAGLQALGRAGRARSQARVVAVTGSVGKTTTKEMLRAALSAFGPTHAAEASYNNHWGVPLTLARLPSDAAFAVVEIGMNNAGEILPLACLAVPHVGIITAIASAHIGRLGSLEAIADEKAALLDGLLPGGVSILPADSVFLSRLAARAPGPVLTFGESPGADIRLQSVEPAADGSLIRADVAGRALAVPIAAPGKHMALNALAALAACHALGLDARTAAEGLSSFKPIAGRGEQRRIHGGQALLLDESYNASAASVRAALALLRDLPAKRRIAVLGDMLELGSFAETEHAGLADDVQDCADLLFTCGPLARAVFDQAPPSLRGEHAADAEALAPIIGAAIRPGDAILVKGSLGSRMTLVVQALERPAQDHPALAEADR